MTIPFWGVGLAGLAAWVFGAIWYTVLAKPWQRAQGLNPDDCKDQKMPFWPLLVALAAAIFMAGTVALALSGLGVQGACRGAWVAFVLGAGLILPATAVNHMFHGRKLTLTIIDASHWVLAVTIEGAILGWLASA